MGAERPPHQVLKQRENRMLMRKCLSTGGGRRVNRQVPAGIRIREGQEIRSAQFYRKQSANRAGSGIKGQRDMGGLRTVPITPFLSETSIKSEMDIK